ncbi:MAG: cisplatin damage response ATP-dependent DNA ligase [Bryobacteraceae bacterium]|nr:cisplatin damage response ATP-dependent DNA ligase [Bryobacteraceae bacterium]
MDHLAQACERIASYNSRLRKVAILADYFRTLADPDLERAVRFLCCGPIQSEDRKFSVGGATLRDAALLATGIDPKIYAICYRDVGDTGETVGLLLHGKTQNEPISLAEAELAYARLYKMRRQQDKVEVLGEILRRHRPITLKYFLKVITGNLRIGLLSKQVEEAIAEATGAELDHVRAASNACGDLPCVALAARNGTLLELEARLFHPMEFMLAKPLDNVADLADPTEWYVEDKYDGFRSQIHVDQGRVVIFTRGMEEVTASFPELVEAFRHLPRAAVLDGEILAWQDGRALSFNVLQQRIARKKITPELMAEVPVAFVAYDLAYLDGAMQIDRPLEARRAAMVDLLSAQGHPLYIAPQWRAESAEHIEQSFLDARGRGNEGLVLKRAGSAYEPAKRSGTWLKVKRPYATLDVVITAAEQGSGRRAIWLSDYTFGVRDADRFLNVGKAYSGLTDQEIRELTRILRAATTDRFGRVALVKPEVVIEVAFDGIQKSSRHKGGYALRFPRIIRWRRDKTPAEADSIDRVRELYEASMARPA